MLPIIFDHFSLIKAYFVEYGEYFKMIIPPLFTSIAIISTWLLSDYQNTREKNLQYDTDLKNNRPVFSFLDRFQTNLVSNANNQYSYLKNFYLTGIDENDVFYSIENIPYIPINEINCSDILYSRFLIDYETSKNEHIICLYQNEKFYYYNLTESQTIDQSIITFYLERKSKYPILNNNFYNDNHVLISSFDEIVKDIKKDEINHACSLLLTFVRYNKNELNNGFIQEKIQLIYKVILDNRMNCESISSLSEIQYFIGNLHSNKDDPSNRYFIKEIQHRSNIDYYFVCEYLEKILKNLNDPKELKFDDFILRNVELYIDRYTSRFSIDYETKIELANFNLAFKE